MPGSSIGGSALGAALRAAARQPAAARLLAHGCCVQLLPRAGLRALQTLAQASLSLPVTLVQQQAHGVCSAAAAQAGGGSSSAATRSRQPACASCTSSSSSSSSVGTRARSQQVAQQLLWSSSGRRSFASLTLPGQAPVHAHAAAAEELSDASDDEGRAAQRQQQQQQQQQLEPQRLGAAEYRRQYSMYVDVPDAPAPVQTFEEAGLPPPLLKSLLAHGFRAPTFIQAQAWPIAMQGRDLVAIASTGSGKTAGFLLPAFMHIQQQQAAQQELAGAQQQQQQQRGGRRGRGGWSRWNDPHSWGAVAEPPLALVLAPTRELAQQIHVEAERLGSDARLHLKFACLYGGASKGPQARSLGAGPQLVIATPGRLLDFVNSGQLDVSRVSMLVLDEADRMLDMGFEPQIRELLAFMPGGEHAAPPKPDRAPPPPRQTLFFSATWPKEVQAIARTLCRNDPVRVFVGDVQSKLVANRDVTQLVAMLSRPEDRLPALMDYIHEHLHGAERSGGVGRPHAGHKGELHPSAPAHTDDTHPRVVVFAGTKRACDELARQLGHSGIRAAAVHGDKTQYERDNVLRAFRQGRVRVLVATDVAARGLDIPGVTSVVNYEFPSDHEMYVHRIGRTGRAGRKGEALTLLTPGDAPVTPVLADIIRGAGQDVPPELAAVAARVRRPAQTKARYAPAGGGRGGGGWRGGRSGSGSGGGRSSGGGRGGGGGWRDDRSGGGGGGWGDDRRGFDRRGDGGGWRNGDRPRRSGGWEERRGSRGSDSSGGSGGGAGDSLW